MEKLTRGRYLEAYKVYPHDASLRLAPKGFCQWCGKPLSGRCRIFCPPIEKELWLGHIQRVRECMNAFYSLWLAIPRFKRVVYVRDNFTCQLCGLRPKILNGHGLEMPDFSKLCIDHIYPYSKGGQTDLGNLQVSCRRCNLKKKDKINYIPQPKMEI